MTTTYRKQEAKVPMPIWDGGEYSRVLPGRYSAVATRVLGPAWVRRFQRWSLMVEFELLGEDARPEWRAHRAPPVVATDPWATYDFGPVAKLATLTEDLKRAVRP